MSERAELYSILYSIATLVKTFTHGLLDQSQKLEYTSLYNDLIDQYYSITSTMDTNDPLSILKFADEEDIKLFKLAIGRIKINNGNKFKQNDITNKKIIAEATASFITLLDAIKLGYNSRDSLHPLLANTLKTASKVIIQNDFPGRSNLVQWLIRINKMSISDKLNQEDLQSLLDDVDSAYSGFFAQL